MSDEPKDHPPARASRRAFLKAGTGLFAGAIESRPPAALAQNADPELARVSTARRILLKGGVVLSQDRQVGDFVKADVLIEAGKIRQVGPELRPDVAADDAA